MRLWYCLSHMRARLKVLAGLLVVCRMASGQEAGPGPQPRSTPADLAEGQLIFGTQCSICHGPKGEGGQGAVLAVPRLPHAPDDQALFRIIQDGIPGTRMPASALTTPQVWQVAAFVRTLGRVKGPKSPGDPPRGQQIYAGKGGCASCHAIGGRDGGLGPDLSDLGARRDAAEIRASLLGPDDAILLDPLRPYENRVAFLQVRVVTKEGQSITGIRINEDSFSIQIRDRSKQFRSFWKNELSEIVKEPKKSLMPSYRNTLTPGELDDLVAYLESLQGIQ
jgi:cytochrome c oxidase cbb3-type subunit III